MRIRTNLAVAAVALALLAAACGGEADAEGSGGLTGEIFVSGSSTVEPISGLNAEKFAEENPGVAISVEGPGTGDGFELFCGGETDISDASRPIAEDEAELCAQNGIEYTELEVAIDGIAVLTSPQNEAVSCVGFGDVYALVGPESEGFDSWADAQGLAAEISSGEMPTPAADAGLPDAPLEITAPGEESGTYDSFIELTFEGFAEDERGQDPVTRPDYVASADDNVIIEGIAGSPSSFGWVGFAFYRNNQDAVKALEVDGGSGCVAPSEETIADGSYPVSRSLYIYVNDARAAESAAPRAFVDFYVSDEGLASVAEVGYVELPPERIEATRAAWEEGRP
ncbi:MAG TPA: substrate-binding domain-containing protein [Actinomycetota bacterium]